MEIFFQDIKIQTIFIFKCIKENFLINALLNIISYLIIFLVFLFIVVFLIIFIFTAIVFIQIYFLIPCLIIIYSGSNILFQTSPENMFTDPFMNFYNIAPMLLFILGILVSGYIEIKCFDYIGKEIRKNIVK